MAPHASTPVDSTQSRAAAGAAVVPVLCDSNGDWEALWLEAAGPWVAAQDLALVAELFDRLDANDDGILQASELPIFRSAFGAVVNQGAQATFDDEDLDEDGVGCGGADFFDVDPLGWASFHAAALSAYGLAAWRRGLESVAAVSRITRSAAPPEEEEAPWTVCVRAGGEIVSAWFSRTEMNEDEKEACRALANTGGWRCLSCEAEALDPRRNRRPSLERAVSLHPNVMRVEPAIAASDFSRSIPATPAALLSLRRSSLNMSPASSLNCKESVGGRRSMVHSVPSNDTVSSDSKPWRSSLWRCQSLGEMMSHRALRPLRSKPKVGAHVVIENISKGTARKGNLGCIGTVTRILIPAREVVKQEWCQVRMVQDDPTSDVCVPISNVVELRVTLRPGDTVEAFRPIEEGRHNGKPSTEVHLGTVLHVDDSCKHMVEVSFGNGDEDKAKIPLSWLRRAVMSAWTQVLRRAPHSTLIFLLFDLGLNPTTPEDRQELEDRVRRDFEPHGRFRFTGCQSGSPTRGRRGSRCESEPMSPLVSAFNFPKSEGTGGSPTRTRLAIGDRGKILSFDLVALEAEVLPDRKRHLRMRVPIDALQPDPSPLELAGAGGSTAMRIFNEDPPLLVAIKAGDVKALRRLLAAVPKGEIAKALTEDIVDADGNTPFHAAAYAQSEEMFKVLWSALTLASSSAFDDVRGALAAQNDWGRSPLWVAVENGNERLCKLLLNVGASVHQESVVLPSDDEDEASTFDFCGGPGLVCEGTTFEVTMFTPAATRCLRFGRQDRQDGLGASTGGADGPAETFVVVRSCGEPAQSCIMPGDLLLSVAGEAASTFAGFRQLDGALRKASRPLTLRFLKGGGLYIRPLHRACELGRDRVVELLLEHQAEPSWTDTCGRSAMDRSVRKRNRQTGDGREPFDRCVSLLQEAGCSEAGRVMVMDAEGGAHPFVPPAHWSPCPQRALEGRFWLRVEEDSSPEALSHFQRIVDRSVGASGLRGRMTKDRRGEPPPAKLMVAKVQRIENVASLREFLQRRFLMRSTLAAGGRCAPISPELQIKIPSSEFLAPYGRSAGTSAGAGAGAVGGAGSDDQGGESAVQGQLDSALNEVYLFHGTSAEGATGIAHEDFQLALAGTNAGDAFGKGIYFAEDCMKCDEYARPAPPGHEFAGLRPVLLCRVLLGNAIVSEAADTSQEVSDIMHSRYDSLIADRKAAVNTYREFIVFDPDQAYADYILWYWRAG